MTGLEKFPLGRKPEIDIFPLGKIRLRPEAQKCMLWLLALLTSGILLHNSTSLYTEKVLQLNRKVGIP